MRKPRDIEGPIHRATIQQLRLRLPGAIVMHAANEFPGSGSQIARAIAKAKKNGMIPGFPDLAVFWRGQVALIEVKAPKGRLSDAQAALHLEMEAQGFRVHVITDPDATEAIAQAMRAASSNWQSVGQVAARIANETARKRCNAGGPDHPQTITKG